MISSSWVDEARTRLLAGRSAGGAWAYRAGGEAHVEPTVLSAFALAATGSAGGEAFELQAAADWLATMQQPNGALGISPSVPTPCWGTAHALLLWGTLGDYHAHKDKAAQWLLAREGYVWPRNEHDVCGHDPAIPGWPWVDGTHPWLEPTAVAVLALRRAGFSGHTRTRDGVRMICDRAIPTGGWNYGNTSTFGAVLHAQPAPTGIALVALAGEDVDPAVIDRACRYLARTLPRVRSPRSLGWGLLGLAAWARRPKHAGAWLEESYRRPAARCGGPVEPAYLLLAGGNHSLDLFGVPARESAS